MTFDTSWSVDGPNCQHEAAGSHSAGILPAVRLAEANWRGYVLSRFPSTMASMTPRRNALTRVTQATRGPRGLGVDEETVSRWEQRGLIKVQVLPSRVHPVVTQDLADVRGGSLTGFPKSHEENLPTVRFRAFVED